MKVILAGGSGFLGRTLAKAFPGAVVLTRRPDAVDFARAVAWDGRTTGDWVRELDGADALVNLAGRSVNCRYTVRNRRQMMESRVLSTRVLGQAISGLPTPPPVWLNSSTATIYLHTFGPAHDESGAVGSAPEANDAFSIEVAKAWEEEFRRAATPSTRKVVMRTAMVFGPEPGGVHDVLRRLTRLWMGGRMGNGLQYVSWLHADDLVRAVEWLIANPRASGIYNLCAPAPLTNMEMMAAFRRVYGRRFGLPASRWMLELGAFFLRTETELVLKSRRVVPGRLLAEGFDFRHSTIESALRALA
jgi:hypothetical protein